MYVGNTSNADPTPTRPPFDKRLFLPMSEAPAAVAGYVRLLAQWTFNKRSDSTFQYSMLCQFPILY